jgi:hypothetical protein
LCVIKLWKMCVTQLLCVWKIVHSDAQLNDASASTGQLGDRRP